MIRGVIFDLGSTLIRFEGEWSEIVQVSSQFLTNQLERDGYHLDGKSFIDEFIQEMQESYQMREQDWEERTSASLLRKVLARFGHREVADEAIERALFQFYNLSETRWSPMEGVYEVLDELRVKGMCLGIISNAGDEGNVQRLIDNAQLRPYFKPIYISAALGIRKPNPKLFEMVLESWDLPADQVVMVGDTLAADILGAQNAGVHQIWLTTQADSPSNRERVSVIVPEATAESITEVPALLLQLAETSSGD
ncbi:MAG: HAD family hydrolase [Anaerolineaceae bacterium]|nr:MAG: HAD family hydrolase [Anaerolineaceae bacterium]